MLGGASDTNNTRGLFTIQWGSDKLQNKSGQNTSQLWMQQFILSGVPGPG